MNTMTTKKNMIGIKLNKYPNFVTPSLKFPIEEKT